MVQTKSTLHNTSSDFNQNKNNTKRTIIHTGEDSSGTVITIST